MKPLFVYSGIRPGQVVIVVATVLMEYNTLHAEAKEIGHFGQPGDVSLVVKTSLTQCALVIT